MGAADVDVVDALAEQHAELDALLSNVDGDGARRESRCEGWTVADAVLHLAQSDELAIASITGVVPDNAGGMSLGIDVQVTSTDEWAEASVAQQRDTPWPAIRERWQRSARQLVEVGRSADPHDRVTWVVGKLSVRSLLTTRLAEGWIHTGDVAHAFGRAPQASDRLWHIARLAWRTLPYAFASAGRDAPAAVAFELRGPGGEPWVFTDVTAGNAENLISGDALELCLVAARRVEPAATSLQAKGPDAAAVLELVRTYA